MMPSIFKGRGPTIKFYSLMYCELFTIQNFIKQTIDICNSKVNIEKQKKTPVEKDFPKRGGREGNV